MKKITHHLPLLQGLLPIDRKQLFADMMAGFTLAALAIPETMGYAKIAGMPVITGLYTMLIPVVLYALFGSSKHLVVGADSATAAILASGLGAFYESGSGDYIAYAGLLAIMVAVLLILARLVRLGFLADFLSRTVLIGFLAGVGIQVGVSQIDGMLGIQLAEKTGHIVRDLLQTIKQLSNINFVALTISLSALAIILLSKKISKKIPGALIVVIGAIIISQVFNLSSRGVLLLGNIPKGLPHIGLPAVSKPFNNLQGFLPTALSMFVVILAQSAATSRAYAMRYDESVNENVDLIGLALANLGAGLSGTFVVNGSPTKTQMVDSAGGRSQAAQVTMAVIVLLVLLFLTGPLAALPEAVLSSVVFLIALELVDIPGLRQIFVQRRNEFWVSVITAAAVVFLGVEQGILLAILLSLLEHTRRGYRPNNTLITTDKSGHWLSKPVSSCAQALPGLVVYRFNHSLYYANCELFNNEVASLVRGAEPVVVWFCLDGSAMDDIDYTAAGALRDSYRILNGLGTRLVLVGMNKELRTMLNQYGLTQLVGNDAFFNTIDELVEAYKRYSNQQAG